MIIVRFYTNEELYGPWSVPLPAREDKEFENLLDPGWRIWIRGETDDVEVPPPFRDAESRRLLRETCDIRLCDEERDWFSVCCEGRRMDIGCLNRELRFALAAIDASRRGEYIFLPDHYVGEKTWQVLAGLPFDILLAQEPGEVDLWDDAVRGVPYRLTHCPYDGRSIDVTVDPRLRPHEDPFYTPLPPQEAGGHSGLFLGADGAYYTDTAGTLLQYRWQNDLTGIMEWIGRRSKKHDAIRLAASCAVYDIFALGRLLSRLRNVRLFSPAGRRRLRGRGDVLLPDSVDRLLREDPKAFAQSAAHRYWKKQFRIRLHCGEVPRESLFKWVPLLMVRQMPDGSWLLSETRPVKYPDFSELVQEVLSQYFYKPPCAGTLPGGALYAVAVDAVERLHAADELKDTIAGFWLHGGRLDVYDGSRGIQIFGRALRMALASGRIRYVEHAEWESE